ncbi:acyltransferase [Planctomycetota bacterium]
MKKNFFIGTKNRILQFLARNVPGRESLRVWLHRWRGVRIGKGVDIAYDVILETEYPHLISIGNNVIINIRSTILAEFMDATRERSREDVSVRIEDDAVIGAQVLILPNVVIGRGAVVTAGSVVTRSVPPMTMVQGNPAVPIAKCGIPLSHKISLKEFYQKLKPIRKKN